MAVVAADLKSPTGEIEGAVLWPGETDAAVTTRLTGYITDGVTQAASIAADSRDAAVKAWAYHRAYMAVYMRLTADPSTVQLNDQGMTQMLVTQIQNWKDLADAKLAVFTELLEAATATEPDAAQPSVAARTVFTW